MTTLHTFKVQVDLPDDVPEGDAESAVAHAVAWYFAQRGLPGNSVVTLVQKQPGLTIANPTPAVETITPKE